MLYYIITLFSEKSDNYNSINISKKLSAFDIPENSPDIYYKDYLPKKYMENFTEAKAILSIRNICIVLAAIEIFSALWGLSYYFIRKVILFFVNFSIIFSND